MTIPTKALFDVSVLIDALTNGGSHQAESLGALQLVSHGKVVGYICAAAIDPLHDRLIRAHGAPTANEKLLELRSMLEIAPVDATVVDAAMSLGWNYLDDAVTHECARVNGLDRLITLNTTDFAEASLPVMAPDEFLAEVRASGR